jgi:uncharacterized protein (DUF488 family)
MASRRRGRRQCATDSVRRGKNTSGKAVTVPMVESVGYERCDIDEFVADLVRRDVELLVDVRLNAVSRRRGFSKTALRNALESAGIGYRHLRALGNPKQNRAAFSGDNVEGGRAVYRGLLDSPAAAAEMAQLTELAEARHVAVMCFERDEQHCHRKVVLDELLSVRAG